MVDEKTPLLSSEKKLKASKEPPNVGFADSTSDQKEPVESLIPVRRLFRFCDGVDAILLTLGAIGCLLYGAITPAQFIIFGDLTDDFVEYTICENNKNCTDPPDLEDSLTKTAGWYIGFAFANFFFSWLGLGLFALSSERQVYKIRLAMFRSAVYQEIGWFDKHSTGELNSRLSEDINRISDGIGSKFGRIISSLMAFAAGYVIGFVYVWRLALVMMVMLPLLLMVGAVMATATGSYTAKELEAYSKAGHVAEQSISSIRTVAAFGGEEKQAELYDEHLAEACKFGIKKGFGIGLGMGAFQFVIYGNYGLSIWYMIKLVRDGHCSPGDGMTTFFAVTIASMILGQTAPSGEALAVARAAGYTVFNIIDRKSEIDASSNAGQKPATIKGDVEFSHIDFVYPTRQSVQILKDFSLKMPSGKRVAFVGESGCGKSTVVKLIQRFYDPVKGSVKLDGRDIKSLNVSYLRSLIGVVNQEPVLFATSIAENIAFGHDGATQREIEEAAKMANAHNFITQFPQGYDTTCGERGVQMSGGQKQRIAIARALVRNPKILLLDEATSALDTQSEAVVQEALDKAGEGRTTIIIAHRLSTIKNADIIVAVRDGHVAEMGTHEELMALDGLYSTLVKLQGSLGDDDDDDDEDDGGDGDDDINKVDATDGAFHLTSFRSTVPSVTTHDASQTQDDTEAELQTSFTTLLKENYPEWKYIVIGCFGAALFGAFPPLFAVSFGGLYHVFGHNPEVKEQNEEMGDDSKKWAAFYAIMGLESGIGIFLQYWFLAKAGEAMTKRLRRRTFLAFLRQEISYYDHRSHGTGAICTRLSVEVSAIQGATGAQLGLITAGIITSVGGIVLGFVSSWQLTLLMIAFIPFLVLSGLALNKFLGGSGGQSAVSTEGALAADETLSNIQTVVSLGLEDEFFERYRQALAIPYRKSKLNSHVAGLANGSFFGIINLAFGAAFRYGGYLVTNGDVTIDDMIRAIMSVLICAVILGQSLSMTPDYAKAKKAANKVFYLLANVPRIDSYSDKGKRPDKCNGEIEISSVRFRYPTRRKLKVLRDLSFKVKPGQTVALVGTSGCGKSTSVSLVERFYDTNTGSVTVDENDVKELNLKWLRSQIGIVSQEPVLFDLPIRDNIAFGDTTRFVSQNEIVEAARSANIHEFIQTLPQGYDTIVGDKGTLISGGQKQRIAIARALVRDPKILLLDEATSALDTESEKVVQQALDKASIGRTTLIIAHRLSTIQHADVIVVIKKGRVVERGTHQQLLALKGIYHALNKAQSLSSH